MGTLYLQLSTRAVSGLGRHVCKQDMSSGERDLVLHRYLGDVLAMTPLRGSGASASVSDA